MDNHLAQQLADLDEEGALQSVRQKLAAGTDPLAVLDACREGMIAVGKRYEGGEYFVSDLMLAGEIFKQATDLLSPTLKSTTVATKGKVVVGTVQGDIHDIGKDLVVAMVKANGYEVYDLGVDVPTEKFVATLKETGATVLGLSGLLTVGYDAMKATLAALDEAGLRPTVKVMIGGGPINDEVCKYTGADAWGSDAQVAVALCDKWIKVKEVA
jgi:methanogenic corrinoid protein MtbC1